MTGEFVLFLTLRSQLSTAPPGSAEPRFAWPPPHSLCCGGELDCLVEPLSAKQRKAERGLETGAACNASCVRREVMPDDRVDHSVLKIYEY